MKRLLLLSLLAFPATLHAQDDKIPVDQRYGRTIAYQGYFPWTPPTSKDVWEKRRQDLREQVLVSQGLWPMPEKTPLQPVIHGKIEREGYTVEKVFFASLPGHYVTGSLYRPVGKQGKFAGVLCPHGHWANGRFYEANAQTIEADLKSGAEQTREGAKYPLQARCAQLARMGCVVFHYDMIGYADSQPLPHRSGFGDAEAELRLINPMGLQTYNSIRALDFLLGLPDVDTKRIGVTGASGGGTQTFMLFAVDDRPHVAFPAVMVSTDMQGGCVCENASYLRIGTGNIELAALTAPRPLGMAAAKDWTWEIDTKGLPQLKDLYKLVGAEGKVMAKTFLQFGHNYNQVSREVMYDWFNEHLKLGAKSPVKEQAFVPIPPKELSVFDEKNPRPKDVLNVEALRKVMAEKSDEQLQGLFPKNEKHFDVMLRELEPALRAMITDRPPENKDHVKAVLQKPVVGATTETPYSLSRSGSEEAIPVTVISSSAKGNGRLLIWVHPEGPSSVREKGALENGPKYQPALAKFLESGGTVIVVEPFKTGRNADKPYVKYNTGYGGYTFGYNRPLASERIRDIQTALAFGRFGLKGNWKEVSLVGIKDAGPWAALAAASAPKLVDKVAVDFNNFRFEQIKKVDDPMLLPGALKYGGLPALTSLAAPRPLLIFNSKGSGSMDWLEAAYRTSGAVKNLSIQDGEMNTGQVLEWLSK